MGLSDEEMAALESKHAPQSDGGLSDDEMAALESGGAPHDPSWDGPNEANNYDVRQLLPSADRVAGDIQHIPDVALLGYGPEALAATNTGISRLVGGDRKYADELANNERIKKKYNENVSFWDPVNLATGGVGLAVGGGPAKVLMKGSGLLSQGVRSLVGLAPKATSRVGKFVQGGTDLAVAGGVGGGVYESSEAPGSLIEKLASVRPSVAGAVLGPALGLAGTGGIKLAQAGIDAVAPYSKQAARYIAERLGKMTPEEFLAAHTEAAAGGKPVVLGDVGPKGVQDAAAVAAREPGQGREIAQKVLGERQQGQVQRVGEDVGAAAGGTPGSFAQTVDEISAQRQAAAKPLYEQAFAGNKPVVSPKIIEITNRPSGKAALQRGLKIAADEGIPESELVIRDAQGNVVGYSAKALHYCKLALDDMTEAAMRSGDNSAARAFTIMKRELLGEMDAQIPAYAKARQAFAGHSANKNALEKGRQAVNAHPDQIRAEMADMSESEVAFYRKGYAQRVIEHVEASPDKGNAANRIFGNTAKRERLRAVLGDEEFAKLGKRLGVEQQMYSTFASANVGSNTAERLAQSRDMEESALGEYAPALVETGLTGNISLLIKRLGMGKIANMLRQINQGRREEIAKMLFSNEPARVKEAVAAIKAEYALIQSRSAAREMGQAIGSTEAGQVNRGIKETIGSTY